MWTALLDLVAPPRCAACGVRARVPWCESCRDRARCLRWGGGCARCAGACRSNPDGCPFEVTAVSATTAAFAYTGVVARTIVAAKVGGHHAAWRPLGAHLGVVVARTRQTMGDEVVVVPVPTEPRRARQRGFDHAQRLASEVAGVLGVPAWAALAMKPRTPDRGRQGHERDLPTGAIVPRTRLDGVAVLLVDDVMTTGATMRAAARAVVSAGARDVRVAVLARAGARVADPDGGGATAPGVSPDMPGDALLPSTA